MMRKTIHAAEFLERSAIKFSDKTAFVDKNKSVNYAEFNAHCDALASEILRLTNGFKRQVPILILLPKGIECLVAFFGVAKSGHFYTLLDAKTPINRILKVAEVLEAKICISSKSLGFSKENLPQITHFLYIEDEFIIDKNALFNARQRHIDTNLLYVLFTSGSTGTPKGVSIAHRSVIDYTFWVCEEFALSENEIIANQAPFYFDKSILDIFCAAKMGATLHILDNALFAFPSKILSYLEANEISFIFWVPSVLIYFANTNALSNFTLKSLKQVLISGEIMPNKHLNYWRKHLPNALFANLYGPTEITDVCAFFKAEREFKDDEILPIGKACRNTELLIFDENLRLISEDEVGAKGTLFVRGTSLSLGYYNDKEKTQKSFIQNPLQKSYPEMLYKTGDIVAYNEFGEILCFGRSDNQIKIKGHRVELGEIESVINACESVKNAACIFKNEMIIAFYEGQGDLKAYLSDKLPPYMIPSKFIKIEKFKLNQNGKIDRRALDGLV